MKNNKIKIFILAIIITVIFNFSVLFLLPKLIAAVFSLSSKILAQKYIVGILSRLIGIIVGIFILKKINIKLNYIFNFKKDYLFLSLIFFVYIAANIEFINITSNMILNLFLMILDCLSVGFYEEFIFRGIILNLFLKEWKNSRNEILFSVIISSLLFGLAHFMNLLSGTNFISVLYQVVYTTIIGIAFSALYIRTDFNLIWCAILHSLYDIASGFGDLVQKTEVIKSTQALDILPYIINISLFLPLIVYAFFILRNKKIENIILHKV